MGGIVGRLFREFAVTLSVAIAISLIVSLTATPAMCAKFLKSQHGRKHGWFYRAGERGFDWIHRRYEVGLGWVLHHPPLMLMVTLLTIGTSVYLYIIVPKGFSRIKTPGVLTGTIQAAQDISFKKCGRNYRASSAS